MARSVSRQAAGSRKSRFAGGSAFFVRPLDYHANHGCTYDGRKRRSYGDYAAGVDAIHKPATLGLFRYWSAWRHHCILAGSIHSFTIIKTPKRCQMMLDSSITKWPNKSPEPAPPPFVSFDLPWSWGQ